MFSTLAFFDGFYPFVFIFFILMRLVYVLINLLEARKSIFFMIMSASHAELELLNVLHKHVLQQRPQL